MLTFMQYIIWFLIFVLACMAVFSIIHLWRTERILGIICVVFWLSVVAGGVYSWNMASRGQFDKLNQFESQCHTPLKSEIATEEYRYSCDVGYFISSLSPDEYFTLKKNQD